MTAKQVLVVMSSADDEMGGSLRAAINTADALAEAGVPVTFTAPAHRSVVALRAVSSMHPLVTVKLFRSSRPAARFGASTRQLWWLFRNMRRFDFVHIHCVFYLGALYSALIAIVRGVPYFVWPHGSLDRYDLRKHRRIKQLLGPAVFSWYLRGARALLCTTTREADDLVAFGAATKREVVPLPVAALPSTNIGRQAWRAKFGVPEDSFAVLFLGRIDPKKGLDRLIEAVALVRDQGVHLVVVGVGDDASSIDDARKQVAALAMTDCVHFTGWLEGADRVGAFAAADVFALASDNENFGIAVVEALLAELPVIVSDHVYISDDLREADGAIITGRGPDDVARAIDMVRTDPIAAEQRAARGRRLALALYSPESVAERMLQVAAASEL